jgi:hypothetical protein
MVTTKSSRRSKDNKIRGLVRREYIEGRGSNKTEYGKSEGSDGNIRVKFKNDDTENGEGSKATLWECKGGGEF